MLQGSLKVRTLIDQASIEAIKRDFAAAIEAEASVTLKNLAQRGVGLLSMMCRARGQQFLSEQWRYTPVQETGDQMMVEIYSRAEDMTFYSRSGKDRRPDHRYPIAGKMLLELLEGGRKPNTFTARVPGGRLFFEVAPGVKSSDFGGAGVNARGALTERSFFGPRGTTLIGPDSVNHPGFPGNRFIETTRQLIEQGIAAEAADTAQRIAQRLA